MILMMKIPMDIIINGEIMNDSWNIWMIGMMFLLEHGQNENSDRAQMVIIYHKKMSL